MAGDLQDWVKTATLIQAGYPFPVTAADFPDWTDGIYQVSGTIPLDADFPDWTKAVGVTSTLNLPTYASGTAATGTTVTVNAPANLAVGDFLAAIYATVVVPNTLTVSGLLSTYNTNSGAGQPFASTLALGTVTGTPPATFTFSCSTSSAQSVIIARYPNKNVTFGTYGHGTGGAAVAPGATPITGVQILIAAYAAAAGTTFATPSGVPGMTQEQSVTSNLALAWYDIGYTTANAFPNLSSAMSAAGAWAAYSWTLGHT